MNAGAIARYLQDHGVAFALVGARAMALRGTVRSSLDTDFLTVDRRVLSHDFWAGLDEASIDVRRGDFDDPLAGVVRIVVPDDRVDVVVGKYKFQKAAVERAERLDFGGTELPVATRTDLVLMKLFAGGGLDVRDIHDMLAADRTVAAEVDRLVVDLPDDAQRLWEQIRSEAAGGNRQ